MRVVKILAILFAVLVVLVIGAVVAAIILINPNDYKDDIAKSVKDSTGRTLAIDGDLGLSLFPKLGVSLPSMTLENAKGFGSEPFATIKEARVGVKIMPLFSGKLEMDKVILEGLQVNLEKNEQGKTNWDDLAESKDKAGQGPDQSQAPEQVPDQEPGKGQQPKGLESISIAGVEIKNLALSYKDLEAGQDVELTNMSLVTGPIKSGEPFELKSGFDYASVSQGVQSAFRLKTTVEPDHAAQRVTLKGLEATITTKGEGMPSKGVEISLNADITGDGKAQSLDVNQLRLNIAGMPVTGKLRAWQKDENGYFSGDLVVEEFSPRKLLAQLEKPLPNTADPKVLEKFSGSLTFSGTEDSAKVEKLALVIDDTRVNGKAAVSNFKKPQSTFEVQVDRFNADRYLPPKADKPEAKKKKPAAKGTDAGQTEIPTEGLKDLNTKGTATIGEFVISGIKMTDMLAKISARDGLVKLEKAGMKLYGGSMDANASLDARKDTPSLAIAGKGASVNIGPLLKDATGKDTLTGTGSLDLNLTAKGKTVEALKETLSGTTGFKFADGSVKGVNLGQLIRTAATMLQGGTPPANEPNQTDFMDLSASMNLVNGLVKNQDLQMLSPLLNVHGKGQANLVSETVDYSISASVVKAITDMAGYKGPSLQGLTIPIKAGGSFSDMKFVVDSKALAMEFAKKEGKKYTDQVEKKLKEQGIDAGGLFNKFLK